MILENLEKMSEHQQEQAVDSDSDPDVCASEEIERLFAKCHPVSQKCVANNNAYIINISATVETAPNVAVNLVDLCEVYNLSNNEFAKLSVLDEHSDAIVDVKFNSNDNNLLYTCSSDGSIKLWDLRTPKQSVIQFIDEDAVNNGSTKPLSCFDISPNGHLLAAGTNVYKDDAYILFWDVRRASLMGAYWESHISDITQVKFSAHNSDSLISGSTDGLINLYDLTQKDEDDALMDTFNTESSVETLSWFDYCGTEIISCITHTADVQFWKFDDVQPYLTLSRSQISEGMKKKSQDFTYIVNVHSMDNELLLLAGSNSKDGSCLRGMTVKGKSLEPLYEFENFQRVRTSWFNIHSNLLLTGGEKGMMNAWNVKTRK